MVTAPPYAHVGPQRELGVDLSPADGGEGDVEGAFDAGADGHDLVAQAAEVGGQARHQPVDGSDRLSSRSRGHAGERVAKGGREEADHADDVTRTEPGGRDRGGGSLWAAAWCAGCGVAAGRGRGEGGAGRSGLLDGLGGDPGGGLAGDGRDLGRPPGEGAAVGQGQAAQQVVVGVDRGLEQAAGVGPVDDLEHLGEPGGCGPGRGHHVEALQERRRVVEDLGEAGGEGGQVEVADSVEDVVELGPQVGDQGRRHQRGHRVGHRRQTLGDGRADLVRQPQPGGRGAQRIADDGVEVDGLDGGGELLDHGPELVGEGCDGEQLLGLLAEGGQAVDRLLGRPSDGLGAEGDLHLVGHGPEVGQSLDRLLENGLGLSRHLVHPGGDGAQGRLHLVEGLADLVLHRLGGVAHELTEVGGGQEVGELRHPGPDLDRHLVDAGPGHRLGRTEDGRRKLAPQGSQGQLSQQAPEPRLHPFELGIDAGGEEEASLGLDDVEEALEGGHAGGGVDGLDQDHAPRPAGPATRPAPPGRPLRPR